MAFNPRPGPEPRNTYNLIDAEPEHAVVKNMINPAGVTDE